jgi:hypothetical protein
VKRDEARSWHGASRNRKAKTAALCSFFPFSWAGKRRRRTGENKRFGIQDAPSAQCDRPRQAAGRMQLEEKGREALAKGPVSGGASSRSTAGSGSSDDHVSVVSRRKLSKDNERRTQGEPSNFNSRRCLPFGTRYGAPTRLKKGKVNTGSDTTRGREASL